ncbi:MAG TPA: hypothetical protein VF995_05120 [Actinomycetota bacterium]
MFVQILQGKVADAGGVRSELDRWWRELGPAAPGWRRLTAGLSDDGELLALLRFDSRESYRRYRARPEQKAWLGGLEFCLAAPVTIIECSAGYLLEAGDSEAAGFIQVVQGRTTDPARFAATRPEAEWTLRRHAPHVLGVVFLEHGGSDGYFTEVTYCTSERETRAAERQMPVEMAVLLGTRRSFVEDFRLIECRELGICGPSASAIQRSAAATAAPIPA